MLCDVDENDSQVMAYSRLQAGRIRQVEVEGRQQWQAADNSSKQQTVALLLNKQHKFKTQSCFS